MSNNQVSAGVVARASRQVCASAAIVQVLILLGLAAWAFRNELHKFMWVAANTSDWAHVLVVPFGILILAWLRRHELRAALTNGSSWGVLLLLLGFGLHAVCLWPFQYAYIREAAIVPVCAGVVLAICGWRVLKRSGPMLLLLCLSVPLGPRIYSALIIRPETYTLASARFMLDQLPGVQVQLDGPDLDVTEGGRVATVAIGEPHRGASLLATYVAIGVFVAFGRIRPFWQVVLLALAAGPLALLCNLFRVVCWGLITIHGHPDPVSPWPRAVAATCSLVFAYLLFACGGWLLSALVVESDDDEDDEDAAADETPVEA